MNYLIVFSNVDPLKMCAHYLVKLCTLTSNTLSQQVPILLQISGRLYCDEINNGGHSVHLLPLRYFRDDCNSSNR